MVVGEQIYQLMQIHGLPQRYHCLQYLWLCGDVCGGAYAYVASQLMISYRAIRKMGS